MADLVLGLAKSAVEGTLSLAKSAIEEEKKLEKSVQRDLMLISDEFEMMHSFLNVANEGEGAAGDDMVRTVVRQVRNMALDTEDCIECVVHLDNSKRIWWRRLLPPCIPAAASANALDDTVAAIELLKARVEAMGQRNMRYYAHISSSAAGSSLPTVQMRETAAVADNPIAMELLAEARAAARGYKCRRTDLAELIITRNNSVHPLQVIPVWGTGGDLGLEYVIQEACDTIVERYGSEYEYGCYAWVKLMHPFRRHEFMNSLLDQFRANNSYRCKDRRQEGAVMVAVDLQGNLAEEEELMAMMDTKKYLVILEDVSSFSEWNAIRMCLPDRNNGSRIIVATPRLEIATLCAEKPYQVRELRQFTESHSVCVFWKQDSGEDKRKARARSGWWGVNKVSDMDNFFSAEAAAARDDCYLVGRRKETKQVENLIREAARRGKVKVVSVWGIGGVGKSALVKSACYRGLYKGKEKYCRFNAFFWANIASSSQNPFDLRDLCRRLLLFFGWVGIGDPVGELYKLLHDSSHRCVVVIKGLQSAEDWDSIKAALAPEETDSLIIVITNEASVATHCAVPSEGVVNIKVLEADAAFELFTKEVFQDKIFQQDNSKKDEFMNPVNDQLKSILRKCGGLPKVIVGIGGFLAPIYNHWNRDHEYHFTSKVRRLNCDSFMHELETHHELRSLQDFFSWVRSYFRTCPDFLKPCIFYLSVFPQDHAIRRMRLLRRWIAEGYCRDTDKSSAGQNSELFFAKLVDLSMIQQHPCFPAISNIKMALCQVNAFFHEYIITRKMEENLVFALEGRCGLNSQRTGRHLAILGTWDRDRTVFESIDFSRLRSLTVFGEWKPFLISDKMRLLRVLDLEDTSDKNDITDCDLERVVKQLTRLKYLSLRGCKKVHCLPKSLGGLKQLQTLDIRNTCVVRLPMTISVLRKLQYVRAGTSVLPFGEHKALIASSSAAEDESSNLLAVAQDAATTEDKSSVSADEPSVPLTSRPRTLLFGLSRFCKHRSSASEQLGVQVPKGIMKLTALHTLGVIDINNMTGKAVQEELKHLTQLRKLGVSGINRRNIQAFVSCISEHGHLESLSLWLKNDEEVGLYDCLDGISPPQNLQSLKLHGLADKLPVWTEQLHNLTKLKLEMTGIAQHHIDVLKDLEKLSILQLFVKEVRSNLYFHDGLADTNGTLVFVCLKFLEIVSMSRFHVTMSQPIRDGLEVLKLSSSAELVVGNTRETDALAAWIYSTEF